MGLDDFDAEQSVDLTGHQMVGRAGCERSHDRVREKFGGGAEMENAENDLTIKSNDMFKRYEAHKQNRSHHVHEISRCRKRTPRRASLWL